MRGLIILEVYCIIDRRNNIGLMINKREMIVCF